jgi:hypothetical protein
MVTMSLHQFSSVQVTVLKTAAAYKLMANFM